MDASTIDRRLHRGRARLQELGHLDAVRDRADVRQDPLCPAMCGDALRRADGREALAALERDERLAGYSFYWAARADVERRAGDGGRARVFYEHALAHARSRAERLCYERRLAGLRSGRGP